MIIILILLSILLYCNAIQRLKDDKGDIVSTTKVTIYGMKDKINSITSALNSFEYSNSNINSDTNNDNNNNVLLYERTNNSSKQYLIINNINDDHYDSNSDISLVYISKDMMINEDKILHRLQCSIQSSLGLDGSETKSTLIILIPEDSNDDYEKICLSMTRSAYTMILNKESFRHPDVVNEMNVIITKPSKFIIQDLLDKIYDNDSSNYDEPLIENLSTYIKNLSKKNNDDNMIKKQITMNMEGYQEAVDTSVDWARNIIKDSLTKLRQTTAPEKDFAIFVTNLVNGSIDKFVKKTSIESSSLSLSKSMIVLGKDYITKEILSMMLPFFRHQIGLVRQESIKSFNAAAVDEITISPKIIDDLNEAKSNALKKFKSDMSALIPNEAKSSWDINFDIHQLKEILDDYIDGRKVQCQLQGVLPRGRKPVDISIHYFMSHPLGRDYRQDPLGFNEKDKIIYEKSLIDSKDVSVHPSIARSILVEQSKVDSFVKKYGRNKIKSDSEFAREMVMFPLSIKNPSVPLMSGRSRKRGGPPKKDNTRDKLGPERFVAWDIKPMDSIKKNIDQYKSSSSAVSSSTNNQQADIIDKVINIIPTLSQGYYSHPSINYGPKYSASRK